MKRGGHYHFTHYDIRYTAFKVSVHLFAETFLVIDLPFISYHNSCNELIERIWKENSIAILTHNGAKLAYV